MTLKEMSEGLCILDLKSCSVIQAGSSSTGGEHVTDFDAMLESFYGNSTLQQLANFAEDVSNGIKNFGTPILNYIAESFTQDEIMNAIEKVSSSTPLKYLEYMPAPDDWTPLNQFDNPRYVYGFPNSDNFGLHVGEPRIAGTGGSSNDRNDLCTE